MRRSILATTRIGMQRAGRMGQVTALTGVIAVFAAAPRADAIAAGTTTLHLLCDGKVVDCMKPTVCGHPMSVPYTIDTVSRVMQSGQEIYQVNVLNRDEIIGTWSNSVVKGGATASATTKVQINRLNGDWTMLFDLHASSSSAQRVDHLGVEGTCRPAPASKF